MNSDPATSRNLSNRTVAIVFGSVILILTVIFDVAGGGWVALAVPLGFLAAVVLIALFQIVYQMLILPALAFLVVGIARLVRLFRERR